MASTSIFPAKMTTAAKKSTWPLTMMMTKQGQSTNTPEKALPQVGKKAAHDPAVYKTGNGEDEDDDAILFTDTPSWNTLNVVMRDQGTLRFVKYLSQAARRDRWDIKGEVEIDPAFDDDLDDRDDDDDLDSDDDNDDNEDDEDDEDENRTDFGTESDGTDDGGSARSGSESEEEQHQQQQQRSRGV